MTTITWDGKTLAADSRVTDGCIEQVRCKKIHKAGEYIIAFCGDYAEGLAFVKWVKDGMVAERKPEDLEDFGALVVHPDGKVFEYTKRLIPLPCGCPTAAGSGRKSAMGALLAGANAVEAVKIAAKLDPYTGGPVQSFTVIC